MLSSESILHRSKSLPSNLHECAHRSHMGRGELREFEPLAAAKQTNYQLSYMEAEKYRL